MKKTIKTLLIIAFGGIGLAGLLFAGASMYLSIDNDKKIEKAAQAQVKEKTETKEKIETKETKTETKEIKMPEETVKVSKEKKISDAHADLNNLVGWEHDKTYRNDDSSWDKNEWGFKLLATTLQEAANESEGDLKEDLERAKNVLDIAVKNKDWVGLIYTHRILHDLDHKINGIKTEDIYDSAKAGAGDGEVVYVYDNYIKEHTK